jgi:hypothetical protein
MDAIETHEDAPAALTQVDAALDRGPRTLTLRHAADWLQEQGVDVSFEALRTMVDRKRLPTVHRDGKRHIEMRALRSLAAARRSDVPPTAAAAATLPQFDVDALVDRLVDAERRAAAAETRGMIAERSESTLTEELHAARTQIAALEEQLQQRRGWFGRRRDRVGRIHE